MSKKFDRLLHRGRIKNGQLVLDNGRWWKGMLSLFEDTEVTILVERRKNKRSLSQNAYLWAVVYYYIAEHTGFLPEEVHECLRSKFLRQKRVWRGMELTVLKSTTQLTHEEFGEYIEQCIREATDLGIEIPPPTTEMDKVRATI